MTTPKAWREIRRATRFHGVTTADALALTPRQISVCCATGVLERRHLGVLVDPSVPRTPLQDIAAAVAAGGPMAAAWGRSASFIWGLLDVPPPTPEIVVPWGRFRKISGVTVHRSRALTPDLVTYRHRIRVTNPLVTVIDAGVVLTPVDVAELIVRGRQLKLFEPSAVEATLRRIARPGRTGVATTRAGLALVMIGDRPADSVLELRFHLGPGQFGLPPYRYQHEVSIGRKRYRIDFAYPEVMLAIEVDGRKHHDSESAQDHDNDRANELALAGWHFLRFRWRRVVDEPARVAAQVLTRLGQLGYRFGT